jgi:hypothetical protein
MKSDDLGILISSGINALTFVLLLEESILLFCFAIVVNKNHCNSYKHLVRKMDNPSLGECVVSKHLFQNLYYCLGIFFVSRLYGNLILVLLLV